MISKIPPRYIYTALTSISFVAQIAVTFPVARMASIIILVVLGLLILADCLVDLAKNKANGEFVDLFTSATPHLVGLMILLIMISIGLYIGQ